jgi:hypothetical protein
VFIASVRLVRRAAQLRAIAHERHQRHAFMRGPATIVTIQRVTADAAETFSVMDRRTVYVRKL